MVIITSQNHIYHINNYKRSKQTHLFNQEWQVARKGTNPTELARMDRVIDMDKGLVLSMVMTVSACHSEGPP